MYLAYIPKPKTKPSSAMKKTSILLAGLFMSLLSLAQTPGVRNTNYLNTNNDGEGIYDMKATPDKGFIVVGVDSAFTFNKSRVATKQYNNLGFIAKLDSGGNVQWRRTNASNAWESAFLSVVISSDGGYVTTGYKRESLPPYDTSQLLIRKYNSSGTLLWEKIYGGSLQDAGYSIAKTITGGYVIAGYTVSNDGDVTGNHGPNYADVWLIKTDADGNAIWKKCYGGSSSDSAYCVIEAKDNKGYVVVGASRSNDGDLRENGGLADGWIFKTDSSGRFLWQQKLGGSNMDGFKSVVENEDGSLTATGYVSSGDTEVNSGFGFHGKSDVLVAKYDRFLMYLWGSNFGGPEVEVGMSITRTHDGNWLIAGFTESNTMEANGNNGLTDAWLLKAGEYGGFGWQKCIGTNKEEFGMSVVALSENDFVVAGLAQPPTPGGAGDFTDGYIAKLGNSNTIKGILYLDANLNGSKDPGELLFSNAIVKSTKSGYERSSIPVNGLFEIDVETGTFTTSPFIQSPYFNVVPVSRISNFPTYFNTDSFSFAIQPIPGIQDLTISAIALNVARPGFDVTYKLDYRNQGTAAIANGTVLFKKDPRLGLLSATPPISSSSGDTLKWDYTNLQPLDSGSITLKLHISAPPIVNNNDTLNSFAVITPVTGDATPSDDTAIIRQRVQGSYDPNDKAENLGGKITLQEVSAADYISYIIRFQNTGTDTAFNITVRDTLDSKLDWNSLEMIGASHPYQMQISNSNMLAWTFDGINLPDSNINEPASHGYIAYRIRPKTTLGTGDIIANNASIYFDFNIPVQTIEALTTVQNIELPLRLLEFSAKYQKPDALLEWSTTDEENVDKFIIERGSDPLHFVPVGTVAAKGGTSVTHYQFKDGLASIGGDKFYYRLKMMDIDQKFKYSNVELVQREGKRLNELLINPNPVRGRTAVAWINFEKATVVELGVFDMQGKYRMIGKQSIDKGFNVIPVDLSALSPGTYIMQAKAAGKVLISRFILTRQ
jgi:uncharacterized repeat protein (TIGR01451 family)